MSGNWHQADVKLEEHNGDIVSVVVEYSCDGHLLGKTVSDSTGIRHYITKCAFDCIVIDCIHGWYWEEVDYAGLNAIVETEPLLM